MLKWAIVCLIASLITGLMGFTDVSAAFSGIAKVLFGIFATMCVIFFVAAVAVGRKLTSTFRNNP